MLTRLLLPLLLVAAAPAPAPPAPFHCQVPCGIYGDAMRVDGLREDAATIAKGMRLLAGGELDMNQTVRWVLTKDEHAGAIQEQLGSYWLAQRIKVPADDASERDVARYHDHLGLLHGLMVTAMRCKQTTDPAHVDHLLGLLDRFEEAYFSEDDLEHLRDHR